MTSLVEAYNPGTIEGLMCWCTTFGELGWLLI